MRKTHRIFARAGAAALITACGALVAGAGPVTLPAVATTQPGVVVPATQAAGVAQATTQPAIAGLATTQPAAQGAATQPADSKAAADERHKHLDPRWRQMNETQRNAQKARWADAPIVQTFKPGALVDLSLANGSLKAETTDLATAIPVRVAVEESNAVWMLGRPRAAMMGGAFGGAGAGGAYVSLSRYDFNAADDEPWHCTLFMNSRTLSLTAMSLYGNTILAQANGVINLHVSEFTQLGQPQKLICTAQAGSIVQLRAEHPEEFRLYALPLLARFSDLSFLQPGAADVYGAFTEIPADQKVAAEVQEIIPQLDADDPADRDAASAKLRQLGAPAVLVVLRLDDSGLSEEQKLRLKSFVGSFRRLAVSDPTSQRHSLGFLIDCLEYEDPAVRAAAKAGLQNQTRQPIDFDSSLTGGAAATAADALRKRLLAPAPPPATAPATQPTPQV